MSDGVTIKILKNGSYQVSGPVTLLDVDGNPFELDGEGPIWLCRCGQSQNKPFCDTSHKRVGFASEPRVTGESESA